MSGSVFQDWAANKGNARSRLVLAFFRLAQRCTRLHGVARWLGWPVRAAYQVTVVWVLGIEIPPEVRIGPGLRLYHGTGLVLHEQAVLGAGCTLRHCTTIGNRRGAEDVPVIGNRVDIGSNSVLLGDITVGDGAVIGAGSVVLDDIPAGARAAGNPARLLTS